MTYGKTTCQIPKKMIPFHFWSPLINRFTSEVYLELKRGEVQVDGNFCELKGVSIASTLQFHHFSFSFSVPCIFLVLCHHIKF